MYCSAITLYREIKQRCMTMSSKHYQTPNIDEDTLKNRKTQKVADNSFTAKITPPLPYTEEFFEATSTDYASLSPGSFSLIGSIDPPEIFLRFVFVIPCSTADGTHPIDELNKGILARLFSGSLGSIPIEKGEITFKRDNLNKTIDATFRVYIPYKHEEEEPKEHLAEGTISIKATGPLCGES